MTDVSRLPLYVANLFTPRPPQPYLRPVDVPPEQRSNARISGVSQYLEQLRAEKENDEYTPTESWLQKQEREKKEKAARNAQQLKEETKKWNPHNDPQVRGDPYKTVFVGRLDYSVTEADLEKEFNQYGPIEKIRVVRDTETGKSRGYAFVVFERERDLRAACSDGDGKRIKNRKIVADVERGRTVKRWLPRRLGGGIGGRNYTKEEMLHGLDDYDRGSRGGSGGGGAPRGPKLPPRGAPGGGYKGSRDRDRDGDRRRDGRGDRGDRGGRDGGGGGGRYRERERDRDRERSPRRSHY